MLVVLLQLATVVAAAPESEAPIDPDIREAITKYEALEFGAVVPLLERALARPALTQDDRFRALAYLGRAHAIFRRPEQAQKAFLQVLALDPDFDVSEAESPLIQQALSEARSTFTATHQLPSEPDPPEPESPTPELEPATRSPELTPASETFDDDREEIPPLLLWGGVAAGAVIFAAVILIAQPWQGDSVDGSLGRWALP